MKKGLLALILAGTMVSVAACGGDKASAPAAGAATEAQTEAPADPKEVYTEATKKTSELKSMDVTIGMNMDMTAGEESMKMTMTMDMKADSENEDDIKLLMDSKVSAEGQDIDMVMFYTDGYYYMDAMGQKMKCAMDKDTIMAQASESTAGMDVDVAWMKDLSLEEQGDDTLIKFTGDPDQMADYVKEQLASSGTDLEGMTMTVKSVTGECLVSKDGYIKSEKLVFDIELSANDQTATMKMDMDMTYNNPGQPVTVELPSTDGFTEVDASALGQ